MSNKIVNYRDLEVWQRAIELTDFVYGITSKFPPEERYGLSAQMRKAAVSIASNIAEGTRHRTPGFISRVIISLGEHAELETQAIIAGRRHYISSADMLHFEKLATSAGQLAHGLLRSLER
ncbi:MAG TPA: four helix bundle protein [Vicinamibacterales bacterium]|nr:four helix bundle protein [Vicinamibacterales bacterium]